MGRRHEQRRGRARWIAWGLGLAGLALGLAVGAGMAWRAPAPTGQSDGSTSGLTASAGASPVTRRETRPTLDPGRFVGKARLAHQVAREIPDVLDRLYCYCECDKLSGHKSLLSCYTDGHAAT